jgi:hypothetical protein
VHMYCYMDTSAPINFNLGLKVHMYLKAFH